jgi:poly-beta-1,6-N-acetyl-D-glucosamine N-deacetylase
MSGTAARALAILALGAGMSLASSAEPSAAPPSPRGGSEFRTLCWHDVPASADGDEYAVSLAAFARELDFLRDDGSSFVSVEQILGAARGGESLPEKSILLTFDDAYETFYANVFPLLKARGYPCVLAVVSSWPDYPERRTERGPRLMTWAEIREVADSGLVEIASHSHDGHRSVAADPYGSTAPALAVRAYDISARSYEAGEDYEARVLKDLRSSARVLEERTGRQPRVLAWPYGQYTGIGISLAARAGFPVQLTLNSGVADTADLKEVPRLMVAGDPPPESLAARRGAGPSSAYDGDGLDVIQADLDLVYDPEPKVLARNVDSFVERIARIRPSAVLLQAFADEDGDGVIRSVYFPNGVLPVKADLFGRVCRALSLVGIKVYAWMPTLSLRLPDDAENERLRVKERRGGKVADSSSWYSNRLSPFSEEAVAKLEELYEDLASAAMIDGVVFQDDGYLNDFEDFGAQALGSYARIAGDASARFDQLPEARRKMWTELKTDKLLELTDLLEARVRKWRPTAAFARSLYAQTIFEPESEEWYAQNFRKSLERYDYVAVMAYPDMEKAADAESWLRSLVGKVAAYPGGLERTIFKTQAYDWSRRRWVDAQTLGARLGALASAGAVNLGYYPDDYTVEKPDLGVIRGALTARPPRPAEAPR